VSIGNDESGGNRNSRELEGNSELRSTPSLHFCGGLFEKNNGGSLSTKPLSLIFHDLQLAGLAQFKGDKVARPWVYF